MNNVEKLIINKGTIPPIPPATAAAQVSYAVLPTFLRTQLPTAPEMAPNAGANIVSTIKVNLNLDRKGLVVDCRVEEGAVLLLAPSSTGAESEESKGWLPSSVLALL
ncbi:2825_t:CDS:1, partial [Acaulospora colombiana]